MTRRNVLPIAALVLVLLLGTGTLAACGSNGNDDASDASAASGPSGDVATVLKGDEQVSQYADAFAAAAVTGTGPFTVFAASNAALASAGITLDSDAIKASVIEGQNLSEADLQGQSTESMLADNKLTTYVGSDGSLYVNDLEISGGPIKAGDGTIFVVNGVIQPKE